MFDGVFCKDSIPLKAIGCIPIIGEIAMIKGQPDCKELATAVGKLMSDNSLDDEPTSKEKKDGLLKECNQLNKELLLNREWCRVNIARGTACLIMSIFLLTVCPPVGIAGIVLSTMLLGNNIFRSYKNRDIQETMSFQTQLIREINVEA